LRFAGRAGQERAPSSRGTAWPARPARFFSGRIRSRAWPGHGGDQVAGWIRSRGRIGDPV